MSQISIIIPVYNVEKYINKCIDSVINQTFRDIEIILVDDGSPDNCGKICDVYAQQDPRIKVIHKENGGLSDARNAGIAAATGKYLSFVDSDDSIEADMYETLYNRIIKDNSDMVICNYWNVDENGKGVDEKNVESPIKDEVLTGEQILLEKLTGQRHWHWVVAWCKLYKKELFEEIRFPKGKIHEDEFIAHKIFEKCALVSCVEKAMYYYLQRGDSIMGNVFGGVKRFDYAEANLDRAVFYLQRNMYSNAFAAVNLAINEVITMHHTSQFKEDKRVRDRSKEIKKIYKKIYFKLLKSKVSIKKKVLYAIYLLDWGNRRILTTGGRIKAFMRKHRRVLTFLAALRTAKRKQNGKVFCLLFTPEHDNIGDAMIALAELAYLKDYFPEYAVCEVTGEFLRTLPSCLRKKVYRAIQKEKVLIQGGGFLGTLWYETEEAVVRDALKNISKSDVTILPQTMYYEDSAWGRDEFEKSKPIYNENENLRICLRETTSYAAAKEAYHNTYLIPDMVMYMNYSHDYVARKGIKLCLRNDVEKTMSSEEAAKIFDFAQSKFGEDVTYIDMVIKDFIPPPMREKVIGEQLMKFKTSELVITDRLHGMIFAAISGTPCIVVNSKSHKVKGCYAWIQNLEYIKFADSTDALAAIYESMPAAEKNIYDNAHLLKYYDQLAEIIGEG